MSGRPIRSCTACRRRRSQDELVRVARSPAGGFEVDLPGAARGPGRGAYVCPDPSCVERALRSGSLVRTLGYKGALPAQIETALRRIEPPGTQTERITEE